MGDSTELRKAMVAIGAAVFPEREYPQHLLPVSEYTEEIKALQNDSLELSIGYAHLDLVVTWTRILLNPESALHEKAPRVLGEILDDATAWLKENETPMPQDDR